MRLKRILSIVLTVAMMLSLCVTATASGTMELEVGDSDYLGTNLDGDTYEWDYTGSAISLSADDSPTAEVTAVRAGSAEVVVMVWREVEETELIYVDPETGEELDEPIEQTTTGTEYVGSDYWTINVVDPTPEPVNVEIEVDPASLELNEGESEILYVLFVQGGASDVAKVVWESVDSSIVSVTGVGTTAEIKAKKAGSTTIAATALRSDGTEADTAYCRVTVKETVKPISVSGGKDLTMKAGTEQNISASVSGGSGNGYVFDWSYDGAVAIRDSMRQNATLYAMDAGVGYVTLTVYESDDPGNYDSTTWTVTVESSATPLQAVIKPSSLTISAGETATLTVDASGGSGNNANYTYNWYSSSTKVAVSGNGSAAKVTATGTGTATVAVDVYDKVTGTVKTAEAVITIEGGSATYNTSGSATVGSGYPLDAIITNLSNEFRRDFGAALSSGAMIRFDSPSGKVGAIRYQNGEQPRANQSVSFGSLMVAYFDPVASGTFSTGYALTDGGNTLSGTITITTSGGVAVKGVSMSDTVLEMATFSSRYLNLKVDPSNAAYNVSWTSSNDRIAYVDGKGASVIVYSRGNVGTAVITATVTGTGGGSFTRSCSVYVSSSSTYNPTLTVTLGSDYYGTDTSDNMAKQFFNVFGYSINPRDARISFANTGNSRYGVMHLANGSSIRSNTSYSFQEWVDMYFEPISAGTFSLPYSLSYKGDSLTGTLDIYIRSAEVSAQISQTSMTLATYSNQSLFVTVTPANAYYSVSWRSSNTQIVSVSGSGVSATVKSSGTLGSATVSATVTDRNGVQVVRSCTVTVTNKDNRYNPSVSTTIGVPYKGTGTSDAMKSQFYNLYGITLSDNALIRFSSTGNGDIGVMRLANGTPIRANQDYTLAEYVRMYTDTVSAGAFSVPYTLTFSGQSLVGNIIVNINPGSVTTLVNLEGTQPYTFANVSKDGSAGSSTLTNALTNAIGGHWSYLRFGSASGSIGTLYRNSSRAALEGSNISVSEFGNLYFVPANTGDYSVSFTAYNAQNNKVADGTLYIRVTAPAAPVSIEFSDVKPTDWFAQSVQWAIARGITNGMGKDKNGKDTFEPNTTCKTAHILTFLWRSQGSPEPTISNPFTNINSSQWFYKAAVWSYEKGLITGTTFNGDMTDCTRGEAVTYMWKLAGKPSAPASNFSDVSRDTELAAAIDWAVSKGITNGTGNDANGKPQFSPFQTCTRGHIVTFLYRAYA